MVKGLDTFWKYFADYEEQYVLIGGAACDILFESEVMQMIKVFFICHGRTMEYQTEWTGMGIIVKRY